MGGGADSRIPGLLKGLLDPAAVQVVARTYDFDPEVGRAQISGWVDALRPDLVIGESLGAIQALRVQGVPHLFVSPSLGAPEKLYQAAWITRFALGRHILRRTFPKREGDRQEMKFQYPVLRKYKAHGEAALAAIEPEGFYYAFFGKKDHYKRSGVVQVELWQQYFGDSFTEYDGTHYMEEEYVRSLLVPKIKEVLALQN